MKAYATYRRSYWGKLKRACEGCRPKLALSLCLFEEGFSLQLFGYFIPLTFLDRWRYEPHEIMESWGFSFQERTLHLNWGRHSKCLWAPWMYERHSNEVWRPDGTWAPYVGCWERDKEPDGRWSESYPYRYTLKSGEVQERTATCHVERSEYRWRGAKWLPWPRKRYKTLCFEFSGEVGERSGSWKGGCISSGYEMLKGETPLDTLRRMERERKF